MILLSLGLPGRFAAWCDGVLAGLAGARGDTVATAVWPPLSELLRIWPAAAALDTVAATLIGNLSNHIVIGLRQPDERLLAALEASETRFVVALDDPRSAVLQIVAETGAELGLATRAVANCCPLMMRFAALPGALALRPDGARDDPGGTVAAIARHFGLARRSTRHARTAAGELPRADPPFAALPEREWRIVDGALAGYAEQFGGGGLGRAVWGRELFTHNAEGYPRPTGVIDIAGPPRPLIFGPYIHLPPGRWSARVILGVSPQAAGCTFTVDAFADLRQLAHASLVPATGGVHAVDLDFALEQPSRKGLEIRVLVTSDGATGQLALGQVVLQPVAMRQPDAFRGSEDFASVLDL